MHKLRVLICDDMEHVRNSHESYLHQFKNSAFYPVTELSESAEKGIELAKEAVANGAPFDLVLMDVDFTRGCGAVAMDGFTGADEINRVSPQSVIVMISAYSTEDNLGLALKTPWVDKFLRRGSFTRKELLDACIFALVRRLHSEGKLLKEKDRLITQSPVVQDYLKAVDRITADQPVVIFGETGTGKELTAKRINANARIASGQESRPLVTINCGGDVTENLSQSEIFGHVKGAFTDAHQDKKGLLERADGGDVFLDELQNAPISFQRLLMRVLEYQEFTPVGGTKPKHVKVRFIAAVNQSLTETLKSGNLMPDLLARIQKGYLVIPPLRDRTGDVRALAQHFLKTAGQADKTFTDEALNFLEIQRWPTNIRGLETVVAEAVLSTKIPTISAEAIRRLPILAQMTAEAKRIEAANMDAAADPQGNGTSTGAASIDTHPTNAVEASVHALADHCIQSDMPLADAIVALEKLVLKRIWEQEQINARVSRRTKFSDATTRRKLAEYGITP